MKVVKEGNMWWTNRVVDCPSCQGKFQLEGSDVPTSNTSYVQSDSAEPTGVPDEFAYSVAFFQCIRCRHSIRVENKVRTTR